MRPQKSDRKWNKRAHISFLGVILLAFSVLISTAGAAPFAYISNIGDNTVSVIDTATDTIYDTINGFDAVYMGVAVSPDGKIVYVANFDGGESNNNVSVINTTENKITANLQLGFEPYAIAVSPDGKNVYVTNSNDGYLSVVNVTDPDHFDINDVEIGGYPTGVVVSPDGTRVYVAAYYYSDGQLKGNVSIINTEDNSLTSTVEVEQMPFGVAISPDGKEVYVTSMDPVSGSNGNVSIINTANNNVVSIEVGVCPAGVAASPDGTRVYVVNSNIGWSPIGNSSVSIIDTTTDQYNVIANANVGWGAIGVSITPDGKKVYVPNSLNNTVSVIDTASNNVIATVPVGVTPNAFGQFIGPDLSAQPTMPIANFTENATSGIAPLTVKFDASTSQYADSYSWDFGDGANSTEQNPVHTYSAAGNYTVNLTVENAAGTDFEVKTDYITVLEPSTPEPVAMFTADATSGTVPLTVNFTDQSTGAPTSWLWDFGDNSNSTEQNPVHTYSAAGNYTVNLKVTNAGGSGDELKTDYITVLESSTPEPEPVAAFTADLTSGNSPLTVNFTDQSTGTPTSWFWDFGDGANSAEQNPEHTYSAAGNYTVNLTVENSAGTDFELKTDYIEVSEASGPTVTLYFDPESSSVSENESTEINIVASNFPAGLSGYNLTVTIDDPTVAEIVDIEYPTWASITENSSLPGTSIYLKTVDGEDAIKEGAEDVVLATLTVSGMESGSANLSIGVKRLEDDSGDTIEATLLTGKIEVALLSPLPDQEYAPRDLDGDGIYEDLTGNGEFSFVDIVAYFHNMDWIEENMPVEYFDFNGNGRIDFDDVVDMFGMI